ncbi:uncharacterized protein LOC131941173 isoform X2 [Physella acuta]|uniref:uncharacterized protein LOC131941173 isoform X2 n=1 Tax=Physella acuta TaxID=109671 RepID=UPI0027DE4D8F|nr:uncharacterized protein LOC131941173 isoform X2 [Physella acuta]
MCIEQHEEAFQPDKLFLFCCGKSVNVTDIEKVLLKLESPFSYLHQKLHTSNTCLCFVLQAIMLQRLADEEEIVDNWGASSYFTDCTECPYVKSSFEFTCCNQIKMICGYCFCKKLELQFDIDVHNDVHSATNTLHFREEKNPESTVPYITCPFCKQGLKFRPI